ncbi:heterokaryon incompatibility protein-domain-containing protein [Boeremia exigua]|uniref:heterokaryon incompatibility protein-domain-containing protein n=1 Tax=Boeremia exigua TaxID=749465 RepID=UPI001E8D989A|nr:heterokaryon incompatibility protein-domain-containing protein [Boeremia exigua]KAH6638784.1 heterokaryon incompatibility protein-domain-containing protein [Boeremia exigua]
MRLINTKTREFEEFIGDDVPGYAILSHTWGKDEVTYQHYVSGNCQSMKGYAKIDMTCRIAARSQIGYAWVDTCCIDKSSSAELSEAINSMFRWYQHAVVCYVYFSDLPPDAQWDRSTLANCRWFTRGWTLQELIAPKEIIFFDCMWSGGIKSSDGIRKVRWLIRRISSITKVDEKLLLGNQSLDLYCVAQKLSWASKRETTRVEDMTYCLIGLFGVNIPLLYGEREKAFRRLQEEILRSSADLSIFAWKLPPQNPTHQGLHDYGEQTDDQETLLDLDNSTSSTVSGVFARSPAEFFDSGQYTRVANGLREISMTNIGIKIRSKLLLVESPRSKTDTRVYFLPLAVHPCDGPALGIWLRHIGNQHFLRKNAFELGSWNPLSDRPLPLQDSFLRPDLPSEYCQSSDRYVSARGILKFIRQNTLRMAIQPHMRILDAWPPEYFDMEDLCFFISAREAPSLCIVRVECSGKDSDCTIIVCDWPFMPKFTVLEDPMPEEALQTIRSIQSETREYGGIRGRVKSLLQDAGIPHSHLWVERKSNFLGKSVHRILPDDKPGNRHRILSIQSSILRAHGAPRQKRSDWSTCLPGEE